MKKLSLVVCVYNEEANIKPLVQMMFESLSAVDYEILFVDDGSTDKTVQEILSFNSRKIKLIELKKNYGQSSAISAGIENAEGEYIATLDGDLQNDPADIPLMLAEAERGGWDMVAGIRKNRKDNLFLRKIPSHIANFIIRSSTGVKLKDYGCTLKVFRNDIAKGLGLYGELHRFIPVLASLEGATITQM
ncbi:MAG: glycosyltransferase family 2 protein, partial [Bacteroidales bacterium]|nr:glycosyltransferase family 2 protein [Bacteroidales bacterium]